MKYKIITLEDKVIICDNEQELTGALSALKGSVKKVSEYTLKTKRPKSETVMITMTPQQRTRYTERAHTLGCRSLQEYIKVLLLADRDLGILVPVAEVKQISTEEL